MTFKPTGAAALCLALLAGCTPMQWVKRDASPEQLSQDSYRCQHDAWRESRLRSWYYAPIGGSVAQDASGRRIVLAPTGPLMGPFGDPSMDEARLAQLCMRERGYQLGPIGKPAAHAETIQPSASGSAAGKP